MNILNVFKIISSLLFLEGEVLFKSIESKTTEGKDIFNKITLLSDNKKDIWLMKQSHHGKKSNEWDSVKIIVDKSFRPFKASFHQLDKEGHEIDFKTSCFRCHSGGPRLIRSATKLPLLDSALVMKWNLLIKSYGEVRIKKSKTLDREVPLIADLNKAKVKLNVKSCVSCHYRNGPRAELTKSQVQTIKHLVKNKQMPPWPYQISKNDKAELNKFIYGF